MKQGPHRLARNRAGFERARKVATERRNALGILIRGKWQRWGWTDLRSGCLRPKKWRRPCSGNSAGPSAVAGRRRLGKKVGGRGGVSPESAGPGGAERISDGG